MLNATYHQLEDGSYLGKIPECKGVLAFGKSRRACRLALQSTLESWMLIGLKLGHALPIIHGINLNKEPFYEETYSL